MAPKREAPLQVIVNTQEDWDKLLKQPALYVVDAYHGWAGPCSGITNHLKRIKYEVDDDLLQFACVDIDKVDTLELFRGWCEPNFLFYGSGVLIGQVRGCNLPAIESIILEMLGIERNAQTNGWERVEIVPNIDGTEGGELGLDAEQNHDDNDDASSVLSSIFDELDVELTVGLIKPDVLTNKQIKEIIKKIKNGGIEIIEQKEMLLTEDEVRVLYAEHEGQAYFDDLVEYMASAPCQALVMTRGKTGQGVVDVWNALIGPFDAAVAKEDHPKSLRAIYGTDAAINALHGAANREEALHELDLLYPDYKIPTYIQINKEKYAASKFRRNRSGAKLQRTLAIIRPDALRCYRDDILWTITKELGLNIAIKKEMELTREQVKAFYEDQKAKPYYPILTKQMTFGPILALCLTHEEDAVDKWKKALGPKTVEDFKDNPECLRSQFHVSSVKVNLLHGSETKEDAENELGAFFQMDQTLAIIKPEGYVFRDKILTKLETDGFVVSARKTVEISIELAEEIYNGLVVTEFYEDLIYLLTSGPSLAVVLSAENAVKKLRKFLGPVDPRRARRTQPHSLRAHFGYDILANSVHAVSNEKGARDMIKKLFPDTRFDWDGYCTENPDKELSVDNECLIPRLRKLGPSVESESEEEDSDEEADDDFVDPGPFVLLPDYSEPTEEELEAALKAATPASAFKGKGKKRKGKKGKGKKGKVQEGKCKKKGKGNKKGGKKGKGNKKGGKKGNHELEDFAVRTSRSWTHLKLSRSQEALAKQEAAEAAARPLVEDSERNEDFSYASGTGGKKKKAGNKAHAVKGKAQANKEKRGEEHNKAVEPEIIECVNSDNPLTKKCSSVKDCAEVARQASAAEIIECVNSDNPLSRKCSSVKDCAEVARKSSAGEIIECVNSDNPLTKKCSSIQDCYTVVNAPQSQSTMMGCCSSTESCASIVVGQNCDTKSSRIDCVVTSASESGRKCQDCSEVESSCNTSIAGSGGYQE